MAESIGDVMNKVNTLIEDFQTLSPEFFEKTASKAVKSVTGRRRSGGSEPGGRRTCAQWHAASSMLLVGASETGRGSSTMACFVDLSEACT